MKSKSAKKRTNIKSKTNKKFLNYLNEIIDNDKDFKKKLTNIKTYFNRNNNNNKNIKRNKSEKIRYPDRNKNNSSKKNSQLLFIEEMKDMQRKKCFSKEDNININNYNKNEINMLKKIETLYINKELQKKCHKFLSYNKSSNNFKFFNSNSFSVKNKEIINKNNSTKRVLKEINSFSQKNILKTKGILEKLITYKNEEKIKEIINKFKLFKSNNIKKNIPYFSNNKNNENKTYRMNIYNKINLFKEENEKIEKDIPKKLNYKIIGIEKGKNYENLKIKEINSNSEKQIKIKANNGDKIDINKKKEEDTNKIINEMNKKGKKDIEINVDNLLKKEEEMNIKKEDYLKRSSKLFNKEEEKNRKEEKYLKRNDILFNKQEEKKKKILEINKKEENILQRKNNLIKEENDDRERNNILVKEEKKNKCKHIEKIEDEKFKEIQKKEEQEPNKQNNNEDIKKIEEDGKLIINKENNNKDIENNVNKTNNIQEENINEKKNKNFTDYKIILKIKSKINKEKCRNIKSSLPKRKFTNFQDFKNEIKNKTKNCSQAEKAYILYLWETDNIEYDMKSYLSNKNVDCTPAGVFKNGKSVCSGYSRLFESIALHINLEVKCISCYAKGYGYKTGDIFTKTNHEYNIINLEGVWCPIDVTWGAGHCNNNKFVKNYTEFYFLTNPEYFIRAHFPPEDKWQLTEKIYSIEEYIKWPMIYSFFFSFGFYKYSPEEGYIKLKGTKTKKFIFWHNNRNIKMLFSVSFYNGFSYIDKKNCSKINYFDDKIEIDCTFNNKGKYEVTGYANSSGGNSYNGIIIYTVEV